MGWLLVILFIIVVIIVWIALIQNSKKYRPDIKIENHDTHNAAHELNENLSGEISSRGSSISVETPAEQSTTVGDKVSDDLTIIEGIGPKVSKILNSAGITRFSDLAAAAPDHLKSILEKENLQFMDPSTWPEQADLAARGDFESLKTLQEELKGGRRV